MKFRKRLIWLLVILAFLFGVSKLAEQIVEKWYAERVIPLESKAYVLIDDIDIQLFRRRVVGRDVQLLDSTGAAVVGTAAQIIAGRISVVKLIKKEGIPVGSIEGRDMRLTLHMENISTVDSTVTYQKPPRLNLVVDDVKLRIDKAGNPSLRNVEISDVNYQPGRGKYDIALKHMQTRQSGREIVFKDFVLIPRYPKFEFGFRHGSRTGRIMLKIPEVHLFDIDQAELVLNRTLHIGNIDVRAGEVRVFTDKRVPIDYTGYKPLPHEGLLNLDLPVYVDSLTIAGVYVEYATINPNSLNEGHIQFEHAALKLTNITNIPERIARDTSMHMSLVAQFENKAQLNAEFDIPLNREDYRFTWHGFLGPMAINTLDTFVVPVANMQITEGTCHRLGFNVISDYTKSVGTVDFQYVDLKIRSLNLEEGKERKFLSAVSNMFIVRTNNLPDEKRFKIGEIDYEREVSRGFEHYVWTSLETGIMHTILPESVANTIERQTAKARERQQEASANDNTTSKKKRKQAAKKKKDN